MIRARYFISFLVNSPQAMNAKIKDEWLRSSATRNLPRCANAKCLQNSNETILSALKTHTCTPLCHPLIYCTQLHTDSHSACTQSVSVLGSRPWVPRSYDLESTAFRQCVSSSPTPLPPATAQTQTQHRSRLQGHPRERKSPNRSKQKYKTKY